MERDGANRSLWQSVEMPAFFADSTNKDYDVIIAGAGITGITAGYLLQKAGKKCLIIEAENFGFGTTGGTTAHINTFYDANYDKVIKDFGEEKAKLLAETGPEVIRQIKTIIEENSIDCGFADRTSYVFSLDKKQTGELEDVFEATKKVGLPTEEVTETPFPIPFIKAIKIEGQAEFHPTKYISAVGDAFLALGGTIMENEMVTAVTEGGDSAKVITDKNEYNTGNFIWATHVIPNINRMNFLAAPYRSYAIAFTLNSGEYPEALGEDLSVPYHYYRSQEIDGKKYVIAGGEDHKTGHEEDAEKHFEALETYVRQYFDVAEVTHRWSSQFYTPGDGLPFIGKAPVEHHVFWATGYDGNGMTFGTLSAMIISDIILGKGSKYEELFSPARFNVKAGLVDTVKESADAVFHLIKDKFTARKIDSLDEIPLGSGDTVSLEGKTMSVYRDELGTVHAVESACTHMGCNVAWNNTEKSWDCPCHGARYDIRGVVLNGPTTKNLKKIDL